MKSNIAIGFGVAAALLAFDRACNASNRRTANK